MALVLVCGCGEFPQPPWVLGEDLHVLGLRTEVIADGPHASGLLPIPADRVKAEAMPGDTIRIRSLVANSAGVQDPARLDPLWLLCPLNAAGCFSTLNDAGAAMPCEGWPEDTVACTLGAAAELELTIPDLDPSRTAAEHGALQIAFLAADPEFTTTQRCLETLEQDELTTLRGCLLAYAFVRVGPLSRLAALATAQGVPLGIEEAAVESMLKPLEQPNFNPELDRLVLFGEGQEIVAEPGSITTLPAGVTWGWESPFDLRDAQTYLDFADGLLTVTESSDTAIFFTEPGLRRTFREQFATDAEAESFTLFVVVSDRRGGQAWAQFDFEVGEPLP